MGIKPTTLGLWTSSSDQTEAAQGHKLTHSHSHKHLHPQIAICCTPGLFPSIPRTCCPVTFKNSLNAPSNHSGTSTGLHIMAAKKWIIYRIKLSVISHINPTDISRNKQILQMWSLRKLSLLQMLSGTWRINDHLPQQDWAPGLWTPASPTAWRAEPFA